jgi:beta-N-acetylhexosaminidase
LFRRNIADVASLMELNRQLLAAFPADQPGLLSVDQEGGRVWRVPAPVLRVPPMRELAAHHDLQWTEATAFKLSTQLRALGFNLNMAPVLDVDTNPDNPIIGDRSFGATPELVIAHGRATLRGMEAAGIAGCGKHFPGHGDTEVDSHLGLPRVRHPRSRINAVELAPFAALAKELPAIMTAHIVFDALDPSRPATLSPIIATDLLRKELGFEGVLLSDDLEMRAISDHYGIDDAAWKSIAAGCDALLICSRPDLAHVAYEALVRRAEASSSFASRLQEAARRVLALRQRYVAKVTATAASLVGG